MRSYRLRGCDLLPDNHSTDSFQVEIQATHMDISKNTPVRIYKLHAHVLTITESSFYVFLKGIFIGHLQCIKSCAFEHEFAERFVHLLAPCSSLLPN